MDEVAALSVSPWVIVAVVFAAVLLLVGSWIWIKTRPAARRARLPRQPAQPRQPAVFPAQVVITPTSLTHFQPQWIGKLEESIHMAHVSSIKIDTHIVFSDVVIEIDRRPQPDRVSRPHERRRRRNEEADREISVGVLQEAGWAVTSGSLRSSQSEPRYRRRSSRATCALNAHHVKAAVDHQHFAGDAAARRARAGRPRRRRLRDASTVRRSGARSR